MPRALWKGAIAFGLVHIPVSVHSAASSEGISFDWLDKRDMAPVGYKRVNKETGKEVTKENIVKGLEYEDGQYVVLTDEEIKGANVKATQTIDIVAFVDAGEVAPGYFETPYYLAPGTRGEKVYALLRETLRKENKIGIALVVLHTKQHLAALVPQGRALVLLMLRWASELRTDDDLELPSTDLKKAGLREKEIAMAAQLVKDMTEKWDPKQYKDQFAADVMAMVKRKVAAGKTTTVEKPEASARQAPASNVIDLTELLQKSLRGRSAGASAARPARTARVAKAPATKLRKRPARPAERKRA